MYTSNIGHASGVTERGFGVICVQVKSWDWIECRKLGCTFIHIKLIGIDRLITRIKYMGGMIFR